MLRARSSVSHDAPVYGRRWQCRAEELPSYECGHVRLSVDCTVIQTCNVAGDALWVEFICDISAKILPFCFTKNKMAEL